MERYQKIMVINGLLVLTVAMLSVFMLMFLLIGGLEVWPGKILQIPVYCSEAGWVRAHSGGVTNGLLVLIIGAILPNLKLGSLSKKLVCYGFVYVAWSSHLTSCTAS